MGDMIFLPAERTELKPWVNNTLNYSWVLQRLPVFVLSIESAYGVYAYLKLTDTPDVIAIIGSIAFDSVFIGMIALSDQIHEIEITSHQGVTKRNIDYLFWLINIGALLSAFLFGLLAHSNGSYALVTSEAITRAGVFPFMSLAYTIFFDRQVGLIKKEISADRQKRKELIELYPLECEYCKGRYKAGEGKRLNGHKAQCSVRAQQTMSNP